MKHDSPDKKAGQKSLAGTFALMAVLMLLMQSGALAETYAPTSDPIPADSRKPISVGVEAETLTLTNDVAIAEAQARAFPNDPEAHFLLAMAYSRTPYLEKSFTAFKRAKKLIKKSPGGYENFDRKLAEYEQMLVYRPDDPLVLYRLGFGYFVRGYGVEEGYIKNSAEPPEFYYALAEKTFEHLLKVQPDDIWAMNYLGFLLIDQNEAKNLDRAMALWERSIAVNPANPGAYFLLGEAWMKKGNLQKALQYGALAMQHRIIWGTSGT